MLQVDFQMKRAFFIFPFFQCLTSSPTVLTRLFGLLASLDPAIIVPLSRTYRRTIPPLTSLPRDPNYSILVLGSGPDIRDECDAPLPPTGPAPLSIG